MAKDPTTGKFYNNSGNDNKRGGLNESSDEKPADKPQKSPPKPKKKTD